VVSKSRRSSRHALPAPRSGARNRPDEFVSGLCHGKLCGVLRNLQSSPWERPHLHSEMIEVAKLLCALRTPLTFVAVRHRITRNAALVYSLYIRQVRSPLTNSQVANILLEVRRSRTALDACHQSQDVERGRRETR